MTEVGPQIIQAQAVWDGAQLRPHHEVHIDSAGLISVVQPFDPAEAPTGRRIDYALLPGFVNAHSHAFQYALRGCVQDFSNPDDDFWSWREAMYDVVTALTPERVYEVSRACFEAMRRGGYTSVGEFHYLRHDDGPRHDFAFDDAVLRAARDVGIRMRLLCVLYQNGGYGQALAERQQRFATPDLDAFWAQIDRLDDLIATPLQSLGVAAHSTRAVSTEVLRDFASEAQRRSLVLHMHLEEQVKEIEACRAAHGVAPGRLVLDTIAVDERFTAVHLTHTTRDDLASLARAGANACICPLTEADLGDGIARIDAMLDLGLATSIGSDQNIRLDPFEELRWLEYGQRLRDRRRGVLRARDSALARTLFDIGTRGGARALGLTTARIAPGYPADFVAIDMDALQLPDGADPIAGLIFSGGREVVHDTCVGGRWLRS